jgi:hypothetical protein
MKLEVLLQINEAIGITKAEGKTRFADAKKRLGGKDFIKDDKGRKVVIKHKDGSIEIVKFSTNGHTINSKIKPNGTVTASSTDATGKTVKLMTMKEGSNES